MRFYIILLVCLLVSSQNRGVCQNCYYKAVVLDYETKVSLPFASVSSESLDLNLCTDAQGHFQINIPRGRTIGITINYMGYQPLSKKVVCRNKVDTLFLHPATYSLEGIVVQGELSKKESGKTRINKEALDYLQPTGLSDVLSLTPGGLVRNPGLRGVQQMSVREVRSNHNTALGTAIVVDGAPISNDANLQGLGNHNQELDAKTTMNGGVDLREVSVDHIESVDVVEGIPSVRYGNLSSGVVILHTKVGYSPWTLRVQSDPYTKLGSIGKGFNVSQGHNLYFGADYAQSVSDKRNPISGYRRLTGIVKYSYAGRHIYAPRFMTSLMYTGTLNSRKFDPEVMTSRESYYNYYNKVVWNNNFSLKPQMPWINTIDAVFSLDYAHDLIEQEKYVSPRGILALPLLDEDGVGEGAYLPPVYYTHYKTDGKPLNLFAQIRTSHRWNYGRYDGDLMIGAEYRLSKNYGRGPIYDRMLPPNPGSSLSSRPIAYRSIPAMSPLSFFVEHRLRTDLGRGWESDIRLGIRTEKDLNLTGSPYDIAKRWSFEPRVYGTLSLPPFSLFSSLIKVNLMGGWGRHIKLPTLSYLYPEKTYFDLVELNYADPNPANRLLWIRTYVRDRANYHLRFNREDKYELGLSVNWLNTDIMLSAFHHKTRSGYSYGTHTYYTPYDKYSLPSPLPNGKPSISDFPKAHTDYLSATSQPDNSIWIDKKGLEYSVRFPQISVLKTNLTFQGAYYKTIYGNSLPTAYRPSTQIEGKVNPYLGYYIGRDNTKTTRFHTLLRTDTHIPKLKLICSTTTQFVWSYTSRQMPFDAYPLYFLDQKGISHNGKDIDLNDLEQKQLIATTDPMMFQKNKEPVDIGFNVKMTKEVNRWLKVSFFVNNLLTYRPVYLTNYRMKVQSWRVAFFGVELQLKTIKNGNG